MARWTQIHFFFGLERNDTVGGGNPAPPGMALKPCK